MRKLILQIFLSVDGFAADDKGTTDFFSESISAEDWKEVDQDQLNAMSAIDTIVLGKNTYEMFANYWPESNELLSDALNRTPKLVFSSSLSSAPWGKWNNAKVVNTNATEELRKLKQQEGKNMIIWGSLSLSRSLLNEKVIDEIQLVICPIVLGKGLPLFDEAQHYLKMNLKETNSYANGVVRITYFPV